MLESEGQAWKRGTCCGQGSGEGGRPHSLRTREGCCDGERPQEPWEELASHGCWEGKAFSIHVHPIANGELSWIWKAMLVGLHCHAEPSTNN